VVTRFLGNLIPLKKPWYVNAFLAIAGFQPMILTEAVQAAANSAEASDHSANTLRGPSKGYLSSAAAVATQRLLKASLAALAAAQPL